MTQSLTIIGGGIVGSTAAYYLSRSGVQVTLFDEGIGQATSASAGIICPWFSLRRNKPWYFLVSQGAEFYRQFMQDLEDDGYTTQDFYRESGAIFIRRTQKRVDQDMAMAQEKIQQSPSIQDVKALTPQEVSQYAPFIQSDYPGIYVKGGARVDGKLLIETLHHAIRQHGGQIIRERAQIQQQTDQSLFIQSANHQIQTDTLLIAAGPHLPSLLEPLGYHTDVHPQKGQLFTVSLPDGVEDQDWPVIIPFGVGDIIPMNNGTVTVGATHEDEPGFDLELDWQPMETLKEEALTWMPSLKNYPVESNRIGTRAQTSDYSVLVGQVPNLKNVYAVSGLGSSGLTSGPYLGYQFSQLILQGKWSIDPLDFPIETYIKPVK